MLKNLATANKKNLLLGFTALFLFTILIYTLMIGLNNRGPLTSESGIERTGKQAPAFSLVNLSTGDTANLSDFVGKPLIINFWASWCTPCRAEMPHFVEAFNQHSEDITFIGINTQDPAENAKLFVEEFQLPVEEGFIILSDANGIATIDYGVSGIPATFFIDENGLVKDRWIGGISQIDLNKHILELLQ
tara:strand:- start:81 stop:650 length:570 start_codon:yes stop_codon:yes gene_type:complete